MSWLFDGITDWIRQFLIEGIMASFARIFSYVNDQVADIANQVGQTPAGWNAGVFAMIQNLSETVILPIAGMILTFVLCYELIQLIIEKNNLQDDVLYRGGYSNHYEAVVCSLMAEVQT